MAKKKKKIIKRVLVQIDSHYISYFCIPNCLEIFSPIPHDAKLIGTHYDPSKDCFFICFEHESFLPISIGDLLPIVTVECCHIVKEKK